MVLCITLNFNFLWVFPLLLLGINLGLEIVVSFAIMLQVRLGFKNFVSFPIKLWAQLGFNIVVSFLIMFWPQLGFKIVLSFPIMFWPRLDFKIVLSFPIMFWPWLGFKIVVGFPSSWKCIYVGTTNSKPPGPITMIDQSEILSRSFFGGLQLCCDIYHPPRQAPRIWCGKNQFPELNQHILTFSQ